MTEPRDPVSFGRYRASRRLGSGAMGEVFAGVDTVTGEAVAIKVLHPHLSRDPAFRARFEQEAHVATLLRSPFTVRLHGYGVAGDSCYLVMDFIDGPSAGELLDREGQLGTSRAIGIALDVARALEEAGVRGIVHRDVKPANILIAPDGHARLADFGIARRSDSPGMTSVGAYIGTVSFSAPEQQGGAVDSRTDIYALGATLYDLLVGHPPFEGSVPEVLRQHRDAPFPAAALAGQPDDVVLILRRCLAKNPADRFQTGSELAGALDRALAGLPAAPAVIPSPRAPGALPETRVVGASPAPEELPAAPAAAEPAAAPGAALCRACGWPCRAGQRFCRRCGASFPAEPGETPIAAAGALPSTRLAPAASPAVEPPRAASLAPPPALPRPATSPQAARQTYALPAEPGTLMAAAGGLLILIAYFFVKNNFDSVTYLVARGADTHSWASGSLFYAWLLLPICGGAILVLSYAAARQGSSTGLERQIRVAAGLAVVADFVGWLPWGGDSFPDFFNPLTGLFNSAPAFALMTIGSVVAFASTFTKRRAPLREAPWTEVLLLAGGVTIVASFFLLPAVLRDGDATMRLVTLVTGWPESSHPWFDEGNAAEPAFLLAPIAGLVVLVAGVALAKGLLTVERAALLGGTAALVALAANFVGSVSLASEYQGGNDRFFAPLTGFLLSHDGTYMFPALPAMTIGSLCALGAWIAVRRRLAP